MVLPLTLLGMSLFGAAHGLGGSKNTFIYSAVRNFGTVIPYLKKIQKCMNHATNPSVLLASVFFYRELAMLLYQEI